MKQLLSLVMVAVISFSTLVSTGCTPQQSLAVVGDIQQFIPVVTNVAEAVCGFSPSAPVCQTAAKSVSASATVLIAALQSYYTAQANGTVPPGIVAALNQAITVFEGDATQILDSVHVLDPTLQTEIEVLVSAAQVLLGVIETLFPAATVAPVSKVSFKAAVPAKFNLSSYVSDYNSKVSACNKYMPGNVKLKKIHIHSLALRLATFGIEK